MHKGMIMRNLAIGVFVLICAATSFGKVKFNIEKEADHYVIRTRDWTLTSWSTRSRTLDYAEQIEIVRTNVESILQAKIPLNAPLQMRVFKDRKSLLNFSKKDFGEVIYMGGYYSSEKNEVVMYEHGNMEGMLALLSHELTHYFTLKIYKSLPLWVNEGFADYIGFSRVRWGKTKGSEPNAAYLKGIRSASDAGTLVPLRTLIGSSQYLEGHQRDLQYAEFWGLVYFFLEGAKGQHRPLFLKYMAELKKTPQPSLDKFIKLTEVEKVWVQELLKVKTSGFGNRPNVESE